MLWAKNIFYRQKLDKESIVKTTSNVTDGLLNVSRLLATQVKQSDETMSHLGEIFYYACIDL